MNDTKEVLSANKSMQVPTNYYNFIFELIQDMRNEKLGAKNYRTGELIKECKEHTGLTKVVQSVLNKYMEKLQDEFGFNYIKQHREGNTRYNRIEIDVFSAMDGDNLPF